MLSKLYFDVNRPYGLPEICFKISDFALSGRLIFFYRAIIFSRIWNGKYWNFSNSWQIQIKRLQISQLVFSKPFYIGLTSEPWIYEKAILFWRKIQIYRQIWWKIWKIAKMTIFLSYIRKSSLQVLESVNHDFAVAPTIRKGCKEEKISIACPFEKISNMFNPDFAICPFFS